MLLDQTASPRLRADTRALALLARISFGLVAVVVLSSILTSQGIIASLAENTNEVAMNPTRMAGYYAREAAYLLLGGLGLVVMLMRRRWHMLAFFGFVTVSLSLVKDILFFGQLNVAIYGLRCLLIAASVPLFAELLRSGLWRQLRIVEYSVKALVLVLIPVTLTQLFTVSSFFGATFLGPRTLGYWSNPINYSMALTSFGLFLVMARAAHAYAWFGVCLALAFTTGGRSGLLALLSTISAIAILGPATQRVSKASLPAVVMVGSITVAALFVLIFNAVSAKEISGREDTENLQYKDGRVLYVVNSVAEIADKGVIPLFLGTQVGDGTNAAYAAGVTSQISDNFFLATIRSFGLAGLGFFFCCLVIWLRKINVEKLATSLAMLSFMLAQSFLELHPVAILTLLSAVLAHHRPPKVSRASPGRIRTCTR